MNGSPYSRRAKAALILSPDSMGAALLGAATELAGFRPNFPLEGETPTDSIRRVKPLVVMIDAGHPIVGDPASLGPALMTGAALVFYGSATRMRDLKVLPATARADIVVLPDDIEKLPAILGSIGARAPGRARSE